MLNSIMNLACINLQAQSLLEAIFMSTHKQTPIGPTIRPRRIVPSSGGEAPIRPPAPQPRPYDPPAPLPMKILFDNNSAVLTQEAHQRLATLARYMMTHTRCRIRLVGHGDRVGTVDYNHRLGQLRADTVAERLVTLGVLKPRITGTFSHGNTHAVRDRGLRHGDGRGVPEDRYVEILQDGVEYFQYPSCM